METQEDIWSNEAEVEAKSHVLCARNGFIRPDPFEYECPFQFIKDDSVYNERFKYYYEQLKMGNMQVL